MTKKRKQPWPTKAVMEQIYNQHLWGGVGFDFYSGEGSHHPEIVQPYIEAVTAFLKSHKTPLTVCDLGCGDFNIGKQLAPHTQKYIGIDIVESLIERNKRLYKDPNLEFDALDISKDTLPAADCVILRQVLQHLSNTEIQNILNKLNSYNYLILTEHLPLGNFTSNKDKISSQGIRLKQNSGVNLLEPPFSFNVQSHKVLHEMILENGKGSIVTTLFKIS